MADPTNCQDFPLAQTMALFQTLSSQGSSGTVVFVEDDAPMPFPAIPGPGSAVATGAQGVTGYCTETASKLVGIDAKQISNNGTTALSTQISIRQVTVSVRVESYNSAAQARNVAQTLVQAIQTDAAGADLNSRNTSFVDTTDVRHMKLTVDNRRVFVSMVDFWFLWTSVATSLDAGSIDHGSITGTLDGTGTASETVTDVTTF